MNGIFVNYVNRYIYYLYAVFIVLLYVIGGAVVYFDRKKIKKEDKKEKEKFYFGTFSRRKVIERKHINADTWYALIMYMWGGMVCFIMGFLLTYSPELRELWRGTGRYVNNFPEIMNTTWIALFGILVVFSTFNKEYWLTFSVIDIMKHFSIEKKMKEMLFIILSVGFLDFLTSMFNEVKYYSYFFGVRFTILMAFVYYMILFCQICLILIDVFFGNRIESIFLDHMYRELWYRPVKKLKREWSNITIQTYVEYLCDTFCYYSKKMKAHTITDIYYASNVCNEEGDYQKKRFLSLRKRSSKIFAWSLWGGLFTMMSMTVYGIYKNNPGIDLRELLCDFIVELIVISVLGRGIYILGKCWTSVSIFLILLMFGRNGYEIIFNKKKIRYVREVAICEWRLYFKYIHTIKNMVAFCYLAMEAKEPQAVNEMMNRCKEECARCTDIMVPMMVIDYVCNELCKKNNENSNEKSIEIKIHGDADVRYLWNIKEQKEELKYQFEVKGNVDQFIKIAGEIAQDIERSITWEKNNRATFAHYAKKWK